MSSALDRQTGQKAHQHPVKAIFLGAARATGRTEHGAAVGIADHQQVAGIDRHAEMFDMAADRFKRGGDHVTTVGDCGRTENDGEFGTGLEHLVERTRERGTLMRHPPFGDNRGARGRQPLGSDFQSLVDHLWRKAGQDRGHDPNLANAVRRHAQ